MELIVRERLVATSESLNEDQARLIEVDTERPILSSEGFNTIDVNVVNTAFNLFAFLIDVSSDTALEKHNVVCVSLDSVSIIRLRILRPSETCANASSLVENSCPR